MGIKETCKGIKGRINKSRAFIELTVGPALNSTLEFDDLTSAHALIPLGNRDNVRFGSELLGMLGVPVDAAFEAAANLQGRGFFSVTATLYLGLNDQDFLEATRGHLSLVQRNRSLLGMYTGGSPRPFARIQIKEGGKIGAAEFLGPDYRGIPRNNLDTINPKFIQSCVRDHAHDERLHYNISILNQIYNLDDPHLAIARYFSLLESMAAPIESQFLSEEGAPPSVARAAIRFMLGYFSEMHIPRFTYNEMDYEFDHIELSGRLRHKVFHGGGPLTPQDLTTELTPALPLLQARPDIVAHMLRRDCEREIVAWASGNSKAFRAVQGESFTRPGRDPSYNGSLLPRPLVSSNGPYRSPIGSVYAAIEGNGSLDDVRVVVEGAPRSV